MYWRDGIDPLNAKVLCMTQKIPESLMIWDCFSCHTVGTLVVLPRNEKMNQCNYLQLLCDFLPNCFDTCKAETFTLFFCPVLLKHARQSSLHKAKSVLGRLNDCQVAFTED